jgi:hypothetical protein
MSPRTLSTLSLTALLVALAASFVSAHPQADCSEEGHTSSKEAQPTESSSKESASKEAQPLIKRGAAISQGEPISLDDVASDPERFANKEVLVTGEISAVCQAKGCWMTLAGSKPTSRARVTFKDYAFFAPKDAKGKRVTLEGQVKVKVMSDAERQHLAEDGRVSVDQIPKAELRLVAKGIEIKP